ncbi:MAG: ABC-F family ATP-binding cassette domain-containing protein [Alphaproteobacteria bacterium]|nr:ABC-F family ATP-binding cassette domain-containing protein [Alphaproteobacteria bacterium]
MLFSVTDIAKSFGPHDVFSNLSFRVDEGQKIALVGENGVGKSTLLKCIAGIEEVDAGTIDIADGRRIAYLPQEISIEDSRTTKEYVQSSAQGQFEEHKVFALMDGFGLSQHVWVTPLQKLSGGQKSKVLFLRFLLEDADVYLLDEPTNNLDMKALLWLEAYLSQTKKSMLIISHDVYFLKRVANRVIELTGEDGISSSRGSYADYLERKDKHFLQQMQAYKEYRKKMTQLEKTSRSIQDKQKDIDTHETSDSDKYTSGFQKDRATSGMSQSQVLKKKMEQIEIVEKPFEEDVYEIEIQSKYLETDLSIRLKDVVAGYKHAHNKRGSLAIGPFSTTLTPGKRICIMGGNGEGKTTLIKTILGDLNPLEGTIDISENIIFGDLLQQQERAERSKTVIEFMMSETHCNEERARHILKKYHLPENIFYAKIEGLSSGTRARLLIACFAVLGVNTLVLDEPTNHLDIEGVRAIVQMLDSYKGIVIIISHNRWFLEQVRIDEYFSLKDGTLERIADIEKYITDAKAESAKMVKKIARLV